MIWSNMSKVQGIGIDINILWMAEKSTWQCKVEVQWHKLGPESERKAWGLNWKEDESIKHKILIYSREHIDNLVSS